MNLFLFKISALCLALGACAAKSISPRQQFSGMYKVRIELQKNKLQMPGLRDSVEAGMKSTQKALSEAQHMTDLDLTKIDTSTIEGKVEYSATAFAKSISQIGIQLGNVGDEIGKYADQLSTESISGLASFLDQQIFEVQLFEDGSIKTKGDMITRFIFKMYLWDVKDNQFVLSDENNNLIQNFEIQERTQNSFVVQNDLLKLHFQKVQ